MHAYCAKCKVQRELTQAQRVTTQNGRPALMGTCAVCGATLYKAGATLTPQEDA